MFDVDPFVFGPAFVIKLYASFLVGTILPKEEKVDFVFIFCLRSLCLDICGRTVKLSFLSCGFKGVCQTTEIHTAGELYGWQWRML